MTGGRKKLAKKGRTISIYLRPGRDDELLEYINGLHRGDRGRHLREMLYRALYKLPGEYQNQNAACNPQQTLYRKRHL